jgi:hypothetical protein
MGDVQQRQETGTVSPPIAEQQQDGQNKKPNRELSKTKREPKQSPYSGEFTLESGDGRVFKVNLADGRNIEEWQHAIRAQGADDIAADLVGKRFAPSLSARLDYVGYELQRSAPLSTRLINIGHEVYNAANDIAQRISDVFISKNDKKGAKQPANRKEKIRQQETELIHFYNKIDDYEQFALQLPRNFTEADVNRELKRAGFDYSYSPEKWIPKSDKTVRDERIAQQKDPEMETIVLRSEKDGRVLVSFEAPKNATRTQLNQAAQAAGLDYKISRP